MKISFFTFIFLLIINGVYSQSWQNPIVKQGRLGSPLVETSPFVFGEELYLLENNQKFWDLPNTKPGDFFQEDEVRIRRLKDNKIISIPLKNHGFATVLVWEDQVYIFAGSFGENKPWRQITEITMTVSKDLIHWSPPTVIVQAQPGEYFYNTAVCRGKDSFILLYETNDRQWTPFTFRYMTSKDLFHWKPIPNAIYGQDKYVGGPALYFEQNWYYTLYLERVERGYETRITRSRDLIDWQDAPDDRPFITFDTTHQYIPLLDPLIRESNASDVELCYYKGQTILFFTGSDQTTAGDLQWATYDGHPKSLFESFFEDLQVSAKPPMHEGDWLPILLPPSETRNILDYSGPSFATKPDSLQQAFQQDQLGAFIHFGPATYVESDMMIVPPTDIFNPTKLNAEQWVKTAVKFGAKYVVLTAKHHNGFCLWPSKTTNYDVQSSSWRTGDGDVVADFVKACRKYQVKIGLYLSGGDKYFGCTSTPDPQGERKIVGDVHQYFSVFLMQLRELLTQYGKIDYVWFDGAYDPFGWDVKDADSGISFGLDYGDAIRSMVSHLQPHALVMGGTRPDVRWSGSEQGWAEYPLWNVVEPGTGLKKWVGPQNAGWIPAEANLHTRDTWFWRSNSDNTLRDLSYLKQTYFNTVGRGSNLLINMTPDTSGLIPEAEVDLLTDFGEWLKVDEKDVEKVPVTIRTHGYQKELILQHSKRVNTVFLKENIAEGQMIDHYVVEAWIEGEWVKIADGVTIGAQRIQKINPITSEKFRITLNAGVSLSQITEFDVKWLEE